MVRTLERTNGNQEAEEGESPEQERTREEIRTEGGPLAGPLAMEGAFDDNTRNIYVEQNYGEMDHMGG